MFMRSQGYGVKLSGLTATFVKHLFSKQRKTLSEVRGITALQSAATSHESDASVYRASSAVNRLNGRSVLQLGLSTAIASAPENVKTYRRVSKVSAKLLDPPIMELPRVRSYCSGLSTVAMILNAMDAGKIKGTF